MSFRVLLRSVTPTLDIYSNKVKLIIQDSRNLHAATIKPVSNYKFYLHFGKRSLKLLSVSFKLKMGVLTL